MIALGLVLAAGLPHAQGESTPSLPAPDDAQVQDAFGRLSAGEKKDLADYFRLEAGHFGTVQSELVRFVLGTQDRDPALWPEEGTPPHFDSKEHTPENDIPRHPLDLLAEKVKAIQRQLLARVPVSSLRRAWSYDYATRELRRASDWKDPERIFRNGLAGYPPDLDLAEALVERALDDGSRQKALAAFLHAYTDRDGGVYPGVTLYDAWASGTQIEMPDVDCLGIVHTVLGDWSTWRAPVPANRQVALYDKIGELFVDVHRHRGLRRALATVYLEGSPTLGDNYQGSLDNFHALWEDCRSTPEDMAKRLPAPERRAEFLADWVKTCFDKPEVWDKGLARHRALDKDGPATRALLLRLLSEFAPSLPGSGSRPAGGQPPAKDGR